MEGGNPAVTKGLRRYISGGNNFNDFADNQLTKFRVFIPTLNLYDAWRFFLPRIQDGRPWGRGHRPPVFHFHVCITQLQLHLN